MLELLQTGKALSVFIAIGAIGIVSKLITRSLYKRLVKETDNMAMTKNKNLKVLKQKLENAYRLNQNIVNTQAYLDKQVYAFKFMGASLNGWNNISVQMTLLGLLAGGAASFLSYWYRLDSYYIILYASVGALGSLFLTFLDSSFNISLRQQRLSNSLLEYVDNSVFVRAVRENTGRDTVRDYAAAGKDKSFSTEDRERIILENEIKDGLVHEEEPERSRGSMKNRNTKAEELLRTVRSMKNEESEVEKSSNRTPGRGPALKRQTAGGKAAGGVKGLNGTEQNADNEVRRDIDYLKHSLEQIAASKEKEKSRVSDDWAKNLDSEELKVIGEIMRQYFAGN